MDVRKIAKPTISFVVSVSLSVRMKKLGSHWTDFIKIWYLNTLRKSVEKIQVSFQSNKNNG
jgi:archaellum biogenesis ATPase FlaH